MVFDQGLAGSRSLWLTETLQLCGLRFSLGLGVRGQGLGFSLGLGF